LPDIRPQHAHCDWAKAHGNPHDPTLKIVWTLLGNRQTIGRTTEFLGSSEAMEEHFLPATRPPQ
jgi:hypothetical protein